MFIEAVDRNYKRINEICQFLSRFFVNGDSDRWEKLFDLPWQSNAPCGYVMYNEAEEIVGFIGTIFANRKIDNKNVFTCSLSSWAMDESTRGKGLNLVRKFIKQENVLFLDLTANEPSRKIFNSFKFNNLENFEYIFPAFFYLNKFNSISFNENIDMNLLSEYDRIILSDHKNSCAQFATIIFEKEYIILAYIRTKRKKIPFLEILYLKSENVKLYSHLSDILRYLACKEKVFGVIIDARFTNFAPEKIFFKRKVKHKIVKNNCDFEIKNSDIDMLYTEKVLFCW